MEGPRPRRALLLATIVVVGSTLVGVIAMEAVFRVREWRVERVTGLDGDGGHWQPDSRLGWKPSRGWFRQRTREFSAEGQINDHFMNDRPEVAADAGAIRILALGDSHTFAVGVSQPQTWVRVLEAELNGGAPPGTRYRTYNAAMIGYSMHQYLLRLQDEGPRLKPDYVIVGVSFATDFYDLLPPDRGGWVYGDDLERDYFDVDDNGALAVRHSRPASDPPPDRAATQNLRTLLLRSATARYLRRSPIALWAASHFRLDGRSLWANMDVAMERNIDPSHDYQHRLFRALLGGMAEEARRDGAQLIVVGIPYLPQVYEDIRRTAFAGARYDAYALSRRVRAYSTESGALYIDTTPAMRRAAQATGRWLHYREDGHPTAEGHAVIARAILDAGVITRSSNGRH